MQPPLQGTAPTNLLNALMANPTFTTGEPSPEFLKFLERITNADPEAFKDDEDNSGSCWGHYQFTAGLLTCSRVIIFWASVGSPTSACTLIAAALTTCIVARWLCRDAQAHTFFLSDNYLTEVTTLLWESWRSAGGVHSITLSTTYNIT